MIVSWENKLVQYLWKEMKETSQNIKFETDVSYNKKDNKCLCHNNK